MVAALAALLLAAGPPVTHDVLPVYVSPTANAGVDEYTWTWRAGTSSPLALGVFKRPRTLADVTPARARLFAQFTGGQLDDSRLLIRAGTTEVYAFPADRKQVCVMRLPEGGGSCLQSLIDGAYPQVEPRKDVWGIVDDDAVRVDVDVARHVLHAKLGRNAFYLALPDGTVVPTRIVVHERNRARHVFDVERCRLNDVSPLQAPLGPPC